MQAALHAAAESRRESRASRRPTSSRRQSGTGGDPFLRRALSGDRSACSRHTPCAACRLGNRSGTQPVGAEPAAEVQAAAKVCHALQSAMCETKSRTSHVQHFQQLPSGAGPSAQLCCCGLSREGLHASTNSELNALLSSPFSDNMGCPVGGLAEEGWTPSLQMAQQRRHEQPSQCMLPA